MTMPKENDEWVIPPSQRLDTVIIEVKDRNDITSLFQPLRFPAGKKEVVVACHDIELIWTNQEPLMLNDVVMAIPQDRFETLADLVDAVLSTIRLAFGDISANDDTVIIESRFPSR